MSIMGENCIGNIVDSDQLEDEIKFEDKVILLLYIYYAKIYIIILSVHFYSKSINAHALIITYNNVAMSNISKSTICIIVTVLILKVLIL